MRIPMAIASSLFLAASFAMGGCTAGVNDDAPGGGEDPGGGEAPGIIKEGFFIDSAVGGVEFVSGEQSGLTNAQGMFQYETGQPVEFYLGGILLGRVADGADYLTPIDFFADASDEFHPFVTNLARFLQTIDEDGDPSNGITITESMRDQAAAMTLDFEQSIEDFANDTKLSEALAQLAEGRSLRDVGEAQEHLGESVIGLLAGAWSGTYSGTDAGSWKIDIVQNGSVGAISGTGTHPEIGIFAIEGEITTSGSAEFGSGSGIAAGSSYSGVFTFSGTASGTWSTLGAPNQGSWIGQRDSQAAPEDESSKEEDLLLPPKFSPNACVAETQGLVECAVCVFPDVFPFELRQEHGSGFSFAVSADPTFNHVFTAEGGTGNKTLSAYLYDNAGNQLKEINISCPTDGSSCTDSTTASVSLSPGLYKIKTETHYCDGTSESMNSKTKTRATLTN